MTQDDNKREEFEAIVQAALGQLPGWVQNALHNIDVLIVESPAEVPDADGQDLLGLYVGLPLTEREANYFGELPDVIYIFRRPHLELGLSDDALRQEVAKTLIHEIAHYFGKDDDYLDGIGWG
jgi:predicted Zn-dependent protease with MMP-like domain